MNIVGVYLATVVLLALLGLVMALNFLRYRFVGDRTVALLVLFIVLFLLNVGLTLASLDMQALSPGTTNDSFNSGFSYE
jgi:ABC-type sulfate transport system permease component